MANTENSHRLTFASSARAAAALRGRSRASVYREVEQGVLTAPIKNGARSVAWPVHEIEQINAARVAGRSDDELRALVAELHAARKQAA